MLKRNLILFLGFYILILFQTSFLANFKIFGQVPNLILIFLFLAIFLNLSSSEIPWEAVFAGFFIDIFSSFPLGTSVIILFLESLFAKRILKNFKEPSLFMLLPFFLGFQLIFYYSFFILYHFIGNSPLPRFDNAFLFQIISNSIFAILGFYPLKMLKQRFFIERHVESF